MNDTDSYNTFYHEKCASVKEEIEKKLGFRPQKTIVYNQLLPYADQLLTEAGETLAEIKANLGCAILKRELRPGECSVSSISTKSRDVMLLFKSVFFLYSHSGEPLDGPIGQVHTPLRSYVFQRRPCALSQVRP